MDRVQLTDLCSTSTKSVLSSIKYEISFVTSSPEPAHAVMMWRVWDVNSILLVGFGFQILLGCEAIVGGMVLRESCINGEKGERDGIHLVIQS
jgi:hypothetical protein